MKEYLRGQVARMTDVNVETVRYYETEGLLDEPLRTESGYRLYPETTLARLKFIKVCKLQGFTLNQIKEILKKAENKSVDLCEIYRVMDERIRQIDSDISNLQELKNDLVSIQDRFYTNDIPHELQIALEALKAK